MCWKDLHSVHMRGKEWVCIQLCVCRKGLEHQQEISCRITRSPSDTEFACLRWLCTIEGCTEISGFLVSSCGSQASGQHDSPGPTQPPGRDCSPETSTSSRSTAFTARSLPEPQHREEPQDGSFLLPPPNARAWAMKYTSLTFRRLQNSIFNSD